MPGSGRRAGWSADQPALPLELEETAAASGRRSRSPRRPAAEGPEQLALELGGEPELHPTESDGAAPAGSAPGAPRDMESPRPPRSSRTPRSRVRDEAGPADLASREPSPADLSPVAVLTDPPYPEPFDVEPSEYDPDPFAEIPGFLPAPPAIEEWVLLPASLRGRLDLREFARFVSSLRTVARDWEGAPELEEGGLRLRGLDGGAWVYPERGRVRVVTDGSIAGPVAEELISLCRWLETHSGLRLYPAGEANGAGTDRSLDPAEAFGG